MKKQFFRVKQLVDQTVSRAEKSEVLTEDVQSAEKHVEVLKLSCSTTARKICGLISSADGTTEEKRVKKIPETVLGYSMIESGRPLGDKSILRELLTDCGSLEVKLGHELLQHEIEVEKLVLEPLNQVEVEANNITKARRNLNKLILDMDSAKARYLTAQKQFNSGGSVTKMDGIKEEMEEAQSKVDQSRDSLAADIFALLAREAELARLILQFADCQRNYHRAALELLDKSIPMLEEKWRENVQKPVFGCDFDEHLMTTERSIALPIEICVCALYGTGMDEEGLFRIAGGASKNRKFRSALDSGNADLAFALDLHDVHIIAGTLKSYLRELPDPLFSHALYDDWVNSLKASDTEARRNALRDVIQRLPETRRTNIRYLIKFFHELSRHQEHNKMSPQNLAIVLAPSLIWSPANGGDVFGLSALANTHASIIEHLISHADWFFPGEIDYYVTFPRPSFTPAHHTPINGDRHGQEPAAEHPSHREEERGHRRVGSYEGVIELRPPSSGGVTENSLSKAESPRPTSRKKNKPAPVPPGLGTPQPVRPGAVPSIRTPDKERPAFHSNDGAAGVPPPPLDGRLAPGEKPSLPPTGPDSRRLTTLEKRPVLAPRPSLNNATHTAERSASQPAAPPQPPPQPPHPPQPSQQPQPQAPIGFELIENELRSRLGSFKSADDDAVEAKRPSVQSLSKRLSSGVENAQQANHVSAKPTQHPNAVPVFGGFMVPVPAERSKFDLADGKPKPSVPERPTTIRIQGATSGAGAASHDQSPNEGRNSQPTMQERIQSFSVSKQQVTIVPVNADASAAAAAAAASTSTSPLSLNSPDHLDIQYADSEDIPPTSGAEADHSTCVSVSYPTPAAEATPKPERPPKPERLNHPPHAVESNNNVANESEEESSATTVVVVIPPAPALTPTPSGAATLPRPVSRPQPPIPPVKPRSCGASGAPLPSSANDCTEF